MVREPRYITTTALASILLYIGSILNCGLAVYGAVGMFYAMNSGANWSRDLTYTVAPAIIAIVLAYAGAAVVAAKEESDYTDRELTAEPRK